MRRIGRVAGVEEHAAGVGAVVGPVPCVRRVRKGAAVSRPGHVGDVPEWDALDALLR